MKRWKIDATLEERGIAVTDNTERVIIFFQRPSREAAAAPAQTVMSRPFRARNEKIVATKAARKL
jgi:hypothetical protein